MGATLGSSDREILACRKLPNALAATPELEGEFGYSFAEIGEKFVHGDLLALAQLAL